MLNPSCSKLYISVMLLEVFSNETPNPAPIVFYKDIRVQIAPVRTVFLKETGLPQRKISQVNPS